MGYAVFWCKCKMMSKMILCKYIYIYICYAITKVTLNGHTWLDSYSVFVIINEFIMKALIANWFNCVWYRNTSFRWCNFEVNHPKRRLTDILQNYCWGIHLFKIVHKHSPQCIKKISILFAILFCHFTYIFGFSTRSGMIIILSHWKESWSSYLYPSLLIN